jgi:hypothetical protein
MGFVARLLGLRDDSVSLVQDLIEDYRAEIEQAQLLRDHAERAKYPQVAASLRRLADMEERHAGLLRDRIAARGEPLPEIAAVHSTGRSLWERACEARARAQTKRRRVLEHIIRWDPEEPNLVALWQQIEREDLSEMPIYEQIVMRGDPHAID